jgi:hypothetical protein
VFREILTITTNWGICFRSNSNPRQVQQMGFGHSFGTAEKQGAIPIQSVRVENGRPDDNRPYASASGRNTPTFCSATAFMQ